MDVVAWGRQTKGGKTEAQIKAAFRDAGYPVDADAAPFRLDEPLDSHPVRLDIEHMPELRNAVHSLVDGGQLVVISLAQFGVPRVWEWVAVVLARKRASIRDLESAKVWDFAVDPGAGFEISRQVEAMSRRSRLEKANQARTASGKLGPRRRLADEETMKRARQAWADSSLSAEKAAELVGIGVATLYRRLGPKTEFEAKAAEAEAAKATKKPMR